MAQLSPDERATSVYINSLQKNNLLKQAALKAFEASEGKGSYVETCQLFKSILELPDASEGPSNTDVFVTTKLSELLTESYTNVGLTWRLECLNKSAGSIRKGNFIILFAYVNVGKTTWLASETTHMFPQIPKDKYLHWYNNEQAGSEVMLRVYQAWFGLTLEELYSNVLFYEQEFEKQTQGRFLLIDSTATTNTRVEQLCMKYPPGLVVIDQLPKIKGVGEKADRDDLKMGDKFVWARELAKTHCPVIAITQADAAGAHKKWLDLTDISRAKIAVQAEGDLVLGIGKDNKEGFEFMRYINIVKNKLPGDLGITDPKQRHGKLACLIDPSIALYKDIK